MKTESYTISYMVDQSPQEVFDAVNKELGLKLEKTKRSYPVLVIDHMEETPTEN